MITTKKNNLKERYLLRYRPFFWNLGPKTTEQDSESPQYGGHVMGKPH